MIWLTNRIATATIMRLRQRVVPPVVVSLPLVVWCVPCMVFAGRG